MLVVDNGDAIRGIAEVVSKLDFTINGYVGTTATQLADGQISNAEGDLYLSSADATVVTSITVVNTDTSARTFTLYLKPSGGTSRAISPVSLDLGIGHCFYTDGQRISVLDASGQLLSTWAVDDTPVDGETDKPISSNWAFDHAAEYGLHAKIVRKTSDQTVNDSIVLVNDDELLFAIGASEVWQFRIYLLYNSGATPDIHIHFTLPAGATVLWTAITNADLWGLTEATTQTLPGSGGNIMASLHGVVINSTTAGDVQLQWAQDVAEASDTKVLTNSCIIAHKLA